MKYSTSQRERELYRYYQPDEPTTSPSEAGAHPPPRSSKDPILTSFAQLGALRLNAKRGLITLSTISTEFIIAESSQSLSLQLDNDEKDQLWHGAGALDSHGCSPGPILTSFFCEHPRETFIFIPDLREDDRFKNMPIVVHEPFVRSLACVPLRAPKSKLAIGIYGIADNKVRDILSDSEMQFMQDMGLTVMDYLESRVMTKKQHRGEKMVKAIGLFIEGKSTMRDSWMELSRSSRGLERRTVRSAASESFADAEFGVQDPTDDFAPRNLSSLLHRHTVQRSDSTEYGDKQETLPGEPSMTAMTDPDTASNAISKAWHSQHGSVSSLVSPLDTVDEGPSRDSADPLTYQPIADAFQETQGSVPSQDVQRVFSRASNLIREAIGVEGVVYLDASGISFSGSPGRTVTSNDNDPRLTKVDGVASDNDERQQRTSIRSGEESSEQAHSGDDNPSAEERCCKVLGFSTRRRSSLSGHSASQEHRSFPEDLLRRLLKQYPHGKVFNFDEDGHVMSDSDPNTSSSNIEPTQSSIALRAHRKAQSRELETKTIIKTFPEARSVLWFPLWDVNSARWSAASFVWSTSPSRALDSAEDSSYLAAFGNSIMAEVSRLSAQVLARMKTDFISSISHELRSPLHGVLASAEFLQETEMTEIQSDLVSNIHASGRVLLDTMNHVLDFSKVNRRSKNKGMLSAKAAKRLRKSQRRDIAGDFATDDVVDISVLCEEVIESVYAGSRVSKKVAVESKVGVIVNIARNQYSEFDVDPGALRRILMNLFSNSIKYTKEGWVMIKVWIENGIGPRRKQSASNLMFKVEDSGKGISKDFLKHHLFKPFEQEDRLASGTGLGLSIIKHIIHDLGGRIDFSSEVGTGTVVKVQIPLIRMSQISPNVRSDAGPGNTADVLELTRGLKFSLEGFEQYPDISETPTGIVAPNIRAALLLKAAVHEMFSDWFEMQDSIVDSTSEVSDVDFIVVMQSGASNKPLNEILIPYARNRKAGQKAPICIVLCRGYHSAPETDLVKGFHILRVQQPYGPQKMAKMLRKVFQERSGEVASTMLDTSGIEADGRVDNLVDYSIRKPIGNPLGHEIYTSNSLAGPILASAESTTAATKMTGSKDSNAIKPQSGNLRALLVDDNEINLRLLTACVKKLQHSHLEATNGLEALETYKRNNGQFDVVFMDISMPVMDGIESANLIRRFELEQGLPPVALIALTGAANPNTRQEAFNSGVDMFMTKPVPMQTIRTILDNLKKNGRDSLAAAKP